MTALKWITNEAKRLRRQHPRRFETWREYVAEASAIYARKHKGKSPVGKKKKRVSNVDTVSKSHVDKNRITANIQVGATGNDMEKQLIKHYEYRLGGLLVSLKFAKTKTERKHFRELIAETTRKLKALRKLK